MIVKMVHWENGDVGIVTTERKHGGPEQYTNARCVRATAEAMSQFINDVKEGKYDEYK